MGVVNGEQRAIFKDPKTDTGMKKSARGLVHVTKDLELIDDVSWEMEGKGALKSVFIDGKVVNTTNFDEIRARLLG